MPGALLACPWGAVCARTKNATTIARRVLTPQNPMEVDWLPCVALTATVSLSASKNTEQHALMVTGRSHHERHPVSRSATFSGSVVQWHVQERLKWFSEPLLARALPGTHCPNLPATRAYTCTYEYHGSAQVLVRPQVRICRPQVRICRPQVRICRQDLSSAGADLSSAGADLSSAGEDCSAGADLSSAGGDCSAGEDLSSSGED
jgi:hypothetical protein